MVPLLDVQDLHLYYADERGQVRAVDGVSFRVEERGQALGIVGESGSGKTSLALAILRMLPENVALFDGRVALDGETISQLSEREFRRRVRWRQIALVPQGALNAFNPVLPVGEQIIEPLLADDHPDRRELRERAEALLGLVGLPPEVFRRYPHELSGGMKQRSMIAAALIMQPPLLILDEPTSALDVSVQAQIMNLLKRLKWDLGLSIIFITHDIALASDLCDSLAVAYAGELVEIGPAEQMLVDPSHPYTQKLLASIPRLHSKERPGFIPGAPPDLRNPPPGCRFHPRCPHALDICKREAPPAMSLEPGRRVNCWLLEPDA